MSTSSARPDDLDAFARDSRAADDELRGNDSRLRAAYTEFQAGTRWGHFGAASLLNAFGTYIRLNDTDARWVAQIAAAFRAAGGDGGLARLPDAAIDAGLRAAGLTGGRTSVTFDSPVGYGFPATTGYADDPVNTASGNFVLAETELPVGARAAGLTVRRVHNSRSEIAGAFGPGWSSWADARLHARAGGADYAGPDGQRARFPRQGDGYGRVLGIAATVTPAATGLTLRWSDGRVWEFDDTGRPLRADEITFSYADGRLRRMTHTGGRRVSFSWTGDRITGAVAADGRAVAYTYRDGVLVAAGDRRYDVDARGRVTTVIDADGVAEATNTYDDAGRVREQVSRFGRRTRYAYLPGGVTVTAGEAEDSPANVYTHDDRGRLLAVVDGHGNRLTRTYDEHGNPVTVTDRNGAVTTTAWDADGRLIRRTEPGGATFTWAYDETGRVVSASAPNGAVVRCRYEGDERTPSEVIDAEGGVTRLDVRDGLVHRVTDPDGVVVGLTHDADGALLFLTDAAGHTARVERDAAGRVAATVTPLGRRTEFRYDDRGRLAERRDPAGGVWRYEYSAAGRVTAVVDPTGARRETRYGPHGAAEATVDPLGHTTTRLYDTSGNLTRLIAADGAKWDFTYDALCRLTATTDPAGATWMREYDAGGNLIGAVDPVGVHRTASVDAAGRVTALGDGLTGSTFAYDDLGRPVAHTRPDGTGARAGYDRCGRRTTVEDPSGGVTRITYTPAGRVRTSTSPGGRTTTLEYDAAGRLAARVDGAGRRRQFRYDADGALVARVRPSGAVETFHYDAAGRLTARELPGGRITRFAHDAAGRVVAVTDPAGGVRRYRYDAAGRLTAAVDPLGGVTRYAYHPRGWLTAITDPLGATTSREYDEAGRPVRETDPLGRVTTFGYDAAGRLVRRVDGAGREVRWEYDDSGRVRSVAAGGGPAVTVERDALGRPVEVVEPGAYRHRLRWDAAGRLVERDRDGLRWDAAGRLVERDRDGLTLRNRYGPDGERVARVLPDGSETTYTYDGGGLLIEARGAGPSGSAGAGSAGTSVTYRRDADGRIVADSAGRRWEYTGGLLTGYRVGDAVTRLRRDAAGRIVAAGDREFRYDAAGQLVAAGTRTFGYDAAGRLTRDGDVTLTYDAAGQLASVGGHAVEYDGSGRRLRDASHTYAWDAFGRLAGVDDVSVRVDAFGELAEVGGRAVLWDRGDPCWRGDAPWPTPATPDWQGTPDGGRDPWGAPARTDADPGPGFRGELEFAGVTWLRHRVYDPDTRAFLSPDPLAAVPGTAWSGNPYHYAGNDPVNRADPSGLRPVTDAELRAYRDDLTRNAFEKGADWVGDNWEYLAAGAMIVGGVALMFTGVGGPAGVALMAASGGLIAGGASAGIQKFTTGEVDWGQVAKDGLVGAAAGGLGAGAAAMATSSARLAATNPLARELLINGAESVVSGGVERGLTGGDIFNPRALATDLLSGGAAPAPGGPLGGGGRLPPDVDDRIPIYRGTSMVLENMVADSTGMVMSDAARRVYAETGSLDQAMAASRRAHAEGIEAWGSEDLYAQAHAEFGTELAEVGERSMISFSTDPAVARQFAGPGGTVWTTRVSPDEVIVQTLPGAGESEVLVRHMIGVERWTG